MLPITRQLSRAPFIIGIFIGVVLGYFYFNVPSTYNQEKRNTPSVTCLIFLKSHGYKSLNVTKSTWLNKCDKYLVIKHNKTRKSKLILNNDSETCERSSCDEVIVSADSSWTVLCTALHLLPRPTDWVLLVPDTSLVVVENLKEYVRRLDSRKEWYMGHPVEHYLANYNIASAGVLLSNGSVETLLKTFPNESLCEAGGKYWNKEDLYLGINLKKSNIDVYDTRDEYGRTRFHGFNVHNILFPGKLFKQTEYYKKSLYPIKKGLNCCSPQLITVDASDSDRALYQYFLLYGVGKTGIPPEDPSPPESEKEPAWITALKDIGYSGPFDNITAEEYYNIWVKYLPPEKLAEKIAETVRS